MSPSTIDSMFAWLLPQIPAFMVGLFVSVIPAYINYIQGIRHHQSEVDTTGSYLHCGTNRGRYSAKVSLSPSPLFPSLFTASLRLFGVNVATILTAEEEHVDVYYYDDSTGDQKLLSRGKGGWSLHNRNEVHVNPQFLALNKIHELLIVSPVPVMHEELKKRIHCDFTDKHNGTMIERTYSITNTNRIYQIFSYELELPDIPLDCRVEFLESRDNRIGKADLTRIATHKHLLKIGDIKPNETITFSCTITSR
jgi:hypothetical protein